MLDLAVRPGYGLAEHLQRLVLRRGGEGEIAGVGQHLPRLHDAVDRVLDRFVVFFGTAVADSAMFIAAAVRPPWLECASSMMMAKLPLPVLVADLVQDERELLHRGDDDLLAVLDELPQVAGVLGVAHRGADLGELLDGVADLLVEDAPVGDDDDRVEDRLSPSFAGRSSWWASQAMELRLAAAGRVLDQIAPARAAAAGHRPGACAPRRAGGSAGRSASRFFLPGLLVLRLRRSGRSSRGCRSGRAA